MSYILEALRKSERQRRANEEQPLARLAAEPPRQRSRWRVTVLVLSALTNVAVLVYLLAPTVFPPQKVEPTASSQVKAVQESATPETSSKAPLSHAMRHRDKPAGEARPEGTAPRTPKTRLTNSAPPAPKANAMPHTPKETVRAASDKREVETERRAVPAVPGSSTYSDRRSAGSGSERTTPVDNGDADATGLPKPKINVYAYSNRNDGDRFVIISNRKYREGDRIDDDGAIVRRIEEHAMTLEFAGQTYKVPRP